MVSAQMLRHYGFAWVYALSAGLCALSAIYSVVRNVSFEVNFEESLHYKVVTSQSKENNAKKHVANDTHTKDEDNDDKTNLLNDVSKGHNTIAIAYICQQ
jgi:hypothetical protein